MTKARDNANGGLGLILIKPSSVVNGTDNGKGVVSFSNVASVSLNNVLSSTYLHYKIVIYVTNASGGVYLSMRLRAAGSDTSTGYDWQNLAVFTTSTSAARSTNQSAWNIGEFNPNGGAFEVTLYNANETGQNNYYRSITSSYQNGSGIMMNDFAGLHTSTTAFDGFTLVCGSNITGNVSVYGYTK